MQGLHYTLAAAALLLQLVQAALAFDPCIPRDFGNSSFVCVCNSTYCDNYDPVSALPRGQVLQVTSDRQQYRFKDNLLTFSAQPPGQERTILTVDRGQTFQTIVGWGGAFTDAAGVNIARLSEAAQDNLMSSYFHSSGLDYSLGRVNMGGCDFSTRAYSYVDTPGDVTLSTFALQEEDLVYKIPYIKKAQSLREDPIKLFGSPWSAPKWMKSSGEFNGEGYLLPEYYRPWAEYFVRFLQEYALEGVAMWGLTAQNEPTTGFTPGFPFNCMGWNASMQRVFVNEHLGPALFDAGFGEVKLMVLDDVRYLAPEWLREVFSDPLSNLYVSGAAIHWYADFPDDHPEFLETLHAEFPDTFLLYSEACEFGTIWDNPVVLGAWERAEKYLHNILEDVNHWVVGWTDWNLALDLLGGPNWANMAADAPVLVDADADEFFKQPMYFALGHISRFMPAGSARVGLTEEGGQAEATGLEFAGVLRPDGGVAIAIMNRDSDNAKLISIHDPDQGYVDLDVGPSSISSVIYWQ